MKTRRTIAALGMAIGGMAPLITGLVGIWGYVTNGYFIAKNGEVIDGPAGLIFCVLLSLAGVGMVVYALRLFHNRTSDST